jgi:redox-sensitive bicupin YhaK (pirin superfamily)
MTSSTQNYAPVTMVEIRLQSNAHFEQELPADYNGFVVMLEGRATIGAAKTIAGAGDVAWLTRSAEPSLVTLTAGAEGARVILYAGKPLRQPVAARGPFVMNTDAELSAAFAEFRAKREQFGR